LNQENESYIQSNEENILKNDDRRESLNAQMFPAQNLDYNDLN
jgi:hypothetical protein